MSPFFRSNGHRSNGESPTPRDYLSDLDPSDIPEVESPMRAAEILNADPDTKLALSFIDRVAGDAEALIEHVGDVFSNVLPPYTVKSFTVRYDVDVDPDATLPDERRVYTCNASNKTFSIASDAELPVVELPRYDRDGELVDTQHVVLHPEIIAAGNDAIIRELALIAVAAFMRGLESLHNGLAIESGLWESKGVIDVEGRDTLDVPEWEPVGDAPDDHASDDEADAAS